ncbi:MAG TPA: hypothetical protein VNT99_10665 [Methylomirabilota bacterium]|nr:hypothetical protein [Methylomirabilota bacterium]
MNATKFDPIPLSWSIKWFNRIAAASDEYTTFPAFHNWLERVCNFVQKHERAV